MKRLIIGIILVILLLVPVSCSSTPIEQEEKLAVEIEIWQIGENWLSPPVFISENVMVGMELEGEVRTSSSHRVISTYNLRTGEKKRVLEFPNDLSIGPLSVYGDRIVWSSSQTGETSGYFSDIFLLDLRTGKIQQITTDNRSVRQGPRIYDDTVVWLDNRDQKGSSPPWDFNVYAYNLSTNQERRLTSTNSATDLSISDSLVVWEDNRHAGPGAKLRNANEPDYNNEIYMYDLNTDQERRVTTDPGNDYFPVADGSRIIWLRLSDWGQDDIFMYDLQSGQERQVTHSGCVASRPSIYGDRIVWYEIHSGKGNTPNNGTVNEDEPRSDIYLYDLKVQKEVKLTSEDEEGNRFWYLPVIHGDYIRYVRFKVGGRLVTYVMRICYE